MRVGSVFRPHPVKGGRRRCFFFRLCCTLYPVRGAVKGVLGVLHSCTLYVPCKGLL